MTSNPSLNGLLADPTTLLAKVRAERARRRLIDFTLFSYPTYLAGWFHRGLGACLDDFYEKVRRRESPRLMIFAPPRSGKSELFSRRGPAFALGRNPDLSIIATSYSADLASRMNRDVQRILDSPEYRAVFPGIGLNGKNIRTVADGNYLRNSDVFEIVGHKGCYRSAGVGGGITGMGADILILDDPIKDAEQAYSETYRDKIWEWYTSTAYTRLMPGGGVLLGVTRWHEDDVAGRLLKAAEDGGDKWDVFLFPAIAEEDEPHRKKGEALHPERFPVERLAAIRGVVGSYAWSALYQQRPQPADGGCFKRSWFRYWRREGLAQDSGGDDELYRLMEPGGRVVRTVRARDCRRFGTVDLATSIRTSADYTVIACWAVTPESDLLLIDLLRDRLESPDVIRAARDLYRRHRLESLSVEAVGMQLGVVQTMRRGAADADGTHRPGMAVRGVQCSSDKLSRAQTAVVRCEAGQIYFPEGAPWLDTFEAELLAFPTGTHDDQVDVTSMAAREVFWGGGAAEPAEERAARLEAEAAAEAARRREAARDIDNETWWGR